MPIKSEYTTIVSYGSTRRVRAVAGRVRGSSREGEGQLQGG